MTETIKGSVVLITGASGAIAQALMSALNARGAAKIYAAARDISGLAASPHLVPIKMVVTSDEDVAKAAVWLVSDDADYVHGASIFVDGGMTLYPGFETGG